MTDIKTSDLQNLMVFACRHAIRNADNVPFSHVAPIFCDIVVQNIDNLSLQTVRILIVDIEEIYAKLQDGPDRLAFDAALKVLHARLHLLSKASRK